MHGLCANRNAARHPPAAATVRSDSLAAVCVPDVRGRGAARRSAGVHARSLCVPDVGGQAAAVSRESRALDVPHALGGINREAWMTLLMDRILRPLFADAGVPIPDRVRVSCGPPPGSQRNRKPYQYCASFSSADNTWEVFISAALDNPLTVGAALMAALVRVCTGSDHGSDLSMLPGLWTCSAPVASRWPDRG